MMTIEGHKIMFDGQVVGIFTGNPSQRMQIEDKLDDVKRAVTFAKESFIKFSKLQDTLGEVLLDFAEETDLYDFDISNL